MSQKEDGKGIPTDTAAFGEAVYLSVSTPPPPTPAEDVPVPEDNGTKQ